MQPVAQLRERAFDQLRKAVGVVGYILDTASPEDLSTYRDGGSGWTVLEVLCHLRDYEAEVFPDRVHMILAGASGDLFNPDPNAWAAEREYNAQDVYEVYFDWKASRETHLDMFSNLEESDWEKAGNHPRRGRWTLNDHLLLTVWHDMNHIEQMTRTLTERMHG